MNRAFPALGLLLGILAAAVVALGVASDLKRGAPRPTTTAEPPAVVKTQAARRSIPSNTPLLILYQASLHTPADWSMPIVGVRPEPKLSIDWAAWNERFQPVPKAAAIATPEPRITCRIVDRRELPRLLSETDAGDTHDVDQLIRTSDGLDDNRERDHVPFGCLLIGDQIVKLEIRGLSGDDFTAWTGALHYGPAPRQTLDPVQWADALARRRAPSLPGDKPLLWSADRETIIAAVYGTVDVTAAAIVDALDEAKQIAAAVQWSQRQVDEGWLRLATYGKRQIWLATIPVKAESAAVRSAQRSRSGKR